MKPFKITCASLLFLLSLTGFSQAVIQTYPLQAGLTKTTTLIFPYSVKQVNLGSRDVAGQILKKADTILQIQAVRKDFPETNMSVVTEDGKLYCFTIEYAASPAPLNISFPKISSPLSNRNYLNPVSLDSEAKRMADQKKFLHITARTEDIKLRCTGLFMDHHILWLCFELTNFSQIDYTPDFIRFYTRDKRKAKRTAIQETELSPLFSPPVRVLGKNDKEMLAFAFIPFGVPQYRRLICQINEKSGGRNLKLRLSHKALLKTRATEPDR